jgi:hypothetical protein
MAALTLSVGTLGAASINRCERVTRGFRTREAQQAADGSNCYPLGVSLPGRDEQSSC